MIPDRLSSVPSPISDPAIDKRAADLARLRDVCKAEFPLHYIPPDSELESWLDVAEIELVEIAIHELARRFHRLPIRPRPREEPDA